MTKELQQKITTVAAKNKCLSCVNLTCAYDNINPIKIAACGQCATEKMTNLQACSKIHVGQREGELQHLIFLDTGHN